MDKSKVSSRKKENLTRSPAYHFLVGTGTDDENISFEKGKRFKWVLPKKAVPGDFVFIAVPSFTGQILAVGEVAEIPYPSIEWKNKYEGDVTFLYEPKNVVTIEDLRKVLPDWKYLTYARSFTTVPSSYVPVILEILNANVNDSKRHEEIEHYQKSLEAGGEFDPRNVEDGREKKLTAIVRRRGQQKFRNDLLECYNRKCAISKCDVEEILEAAHIHPYMGPKTNKPFNGILLRSDLHTLFDLGLLSVDPKTYRVMLDDRLLTSEYAVYDNQKIFLPKDEGKRPSAKCLQYHLKESKLDKG